MLCGLITIKDIEKSTKYPNSAKDKNGRLLCGAAVGIAKDTLERVRALVEKKVDVIVVDTAHGHSEGVLHIVECIRSAYPDLPLIGGNVATRAATHDSSPRAPTASRSASAPAPSAPRAWWRASACRRLRRLPTVRRRPKSTACMSLRTAASSTRAISSRRLRRARAP